MITGQVETLESDLDALMERVPKLAKWRPLFEKRFNSLGETSEFSLKFFSQLPSYLVKKLYTLYQDDFKTAGYVYPVKYLAVAQK